MAIRKTVPNTRDCFSNGFKKKNLPLHTGSLGSSRQVGTRSG